MGRLEMTACCLFLVSLYCMPRSFGPIPRIPGFPLQPQPSTSRLLNPLYRFGFAGHQNNSFGRDPGQAADRTRRPRLQIHSARQSRV